MRHFGRFILIALVVIALLCVSERATDTAATSPPSIDRIAIDTDPYSVVANTATSVGVINVGAWINENNILDAEEAAVDAVDLDIVASPGGVPSANPITGYSYTLNIDGSAFVVQSHSTLLIGVGPGSFVVDASDFTPTAMGDNTYAVSVSDSGPLPASAETGQGVLDRIRIASRNGAASSVYPVDISGMMSTDTDGSAHAPDVVEGALVCINQFCPHWMDVELLSFAASLPSSFEAGVDTQVPIHLMIRNNGEFIFDIAVDVDMTPPAGCTINWQTGIVSVSAQLDGVIPLTTVPFDTLATLRCQPGSGQFGFGGCADIVVTPQYFDKNTANNCLPQTTQADAFLGPNSDNDGDAFSDYHESGTPLCGDGRNEDNADDAVIDDGCPGGPTQAGSFSEAQFNIGTSAADWCGMADWPADLVGGAMSTDKVNIQDLVSYVAPVRHLMSSPGGPEYDRRWDLVPGRGALSDWINVQDLSRIVTAMPSRPPFNGARAFNGPACVP